MCLLSSSIIQFPVQRRKFPIYEEPKRFLYFYGMFHLGSFRMTCCKKKKTQKVKHTVISPLYCQYKLCQLLQVVFCSFHQFCICCFMTFFFMMFSIFKCSISHVSFLTWFRIFLTLIVVLHAH